MRPSRLRPGEWIAGLAGVALLVVMFLDWYQPAAGPRLDAWAAFSITDLFLAAAALAGVTAAVLTAANSKPDAPITWEAGTIPVVLIASLLAVYRLIDPPGGLERDYGLYLGLAAVLGVLVGTWLAMRDERTDGSPEPAAAG